MHDVELKSRPIVDLGDVSLASLEEVGAAGLRGFLERLVLDDREPSAGFQSSL
ncbi:hypothetical protein GCM10010466_27630 [Planomonospora alba]|uniref:FXSXX-COOH protein n=1 Tax=Planomonospora alba TaxID=161354 RepID=A0ABP6N655_9ACTN